MSVILLCLAQMAGGKTMAFAVNGRVGTLYDESPGAVDRFAVYGGGAVDVGSSIEVAAVRRLIRAAVVTAPLAVCRSIRQYLGFEGPNGARRTMPDRHRHHEFRSWRRGTVRAQVPNSPHMGLGILRAEPRSLRRVLRVREWQGSDRRDVRVLLIGGHVSSGRGCQRGLFRYIRAGA